MITMKNQLFKFVFLSTLFTMAGCAEEVFNFDDEDDEEMEEVVPANLTVSARITPLQAEPEMKDVLPLNWTEGDQLMAVGTADVKKITYFDMEAQDAGKAAALFKGGLIDGVKEYKVYYTNAGHKLSPTEFTIDYVNQTQNGNNTTEHIKSYLLMQGINAKGDTKFTDAQMKEDIAMQVKNAVVRFNITNMDAGMDLTQLVWIQNEGADNEVVQTLVLQDVKPDETGTVNAFLCFDPSVVLSANGKWSVKLKTAKDVVSYVGQSAEGVKYEAGTLYNVAVDLLDTEHVKKSTITLTANINPLKSTEVTGRALLNGLALNWEANDKLLLVNKADATKTAFLSMATEPGQASAQFKGKLIEGVEDYLIYFYRPGHKMSTDDFTVNYADQTQKGDNTTAHFRDFIHMKGVNADGGESFAENQLIAPVAMQVESAVMRFDVSNVDPTMATPTKLIWTLNEGSAGVVQQTLNLLDVTASADGKLTAFLCFDPSIVLNAGGKCSVELIADKKSARYEFASAAGIHYEAGTLYTMPVVLGAPTRAAFKWNFDDNKAPGGWTSVDATFSDGMLCLGNDAHLRYKEKVGLGSYTWKMTLPVVTESIKHLMGVSLYYYNESEFPIERLAQVHCLYGKDDFRTEANAQEGDMVIRTVTMENNNYIAVKAGSTHEFGMKLSDKDGKILIEWSMDNEVIREVHTNYSIDTQFELAFDNNASQGWLKWYGDKNVDKNYVVKFDYLNYQPAE